jgi:hypothetical protein
MVCAWFAYFAVENPGLSFCHSRNLLRKLSALDDCKSPQSEPNRGQSALAIGASQFGLPGRKMAGCCHPVATLLPVVLPLKRLIDNDVTDVATLRSSLINHLFALVRRKSRFMSAHFVPMAAG